MPEKISETHHEDYKYSHSAYSKPSFLFFYGDSVIKSCEGTQQGYPESPVLFSDSIQDLIDSLVSKTNLWYLETSFIEIRLSSSKVCKDLSLYLTPELSLDEHFKNLGHLASLLIPLKCELPVSVGSQVGMVLSKSYFVSSYSIIH